MKNSLRNITAFLMAAVLIAGSVFFAGCEKEETKNNPSHNMDDLAKRRLTKEERQIVAGADLAGLGTGAASGAAAGGAIGGAGGAVVGAVIGGLCGGIGASLKARGEILNKQTALPFNINTIENEAGFPENPYDYMGYLHYTKLHAMTEDPALCGDTAGLFSSETYYQTITGALSDYFSVNSEEYFSIEQYEFVENNSLQPLAEIIQTIFSSDTLIDMLLDYDAEWHSAETFSQFYDISVEYEEKLLEYNDIPDQEKQIALSYMSTARYGFWYWEKALLK